jgi:hypothetical protein
MKYSTIYAVIMGLLLFTLASCTNEETPTPFTNEDMPMIYMDWAPEYIYGVGDTIKFTAQVSPSDNVVSRWLVDGVVVSEGLSINYPIVTDEPFNLRFEVERFGLTNFRSANVTVTKEFEAKTYKKIVLGVISQDATLGSIQWDNITHLMYTSLVVDNTTPTLKMPNASSLERLRSIVSAAHNNGVYVIIDITGPINYLHGGGNYNETSFNQVAIDPEKRGKLITDIKAFVEEYDLDGVNVYINNLNNDAGGLSDKEEITAFMNELGASLPESRPDPRNEFFFTASVSMAWNNSEFYYVANVPRLNWVNFMLFGGVDLSPVHHAPLWQVNDNIARFQNAGLDVSKMLIGIGAFGVQYNLNGASPTWGNLDSFLQYRPYKEIIGLDADAANLNQLPLGDGLFYSGVTDVNAKAEIVISSNAAGMFIWTMENDTQAVGKSLTKAMNDKLNTQ